ncbi:MAG: HEAT repeat domain-containing protein [SAR324 cluster bacterium]|nr:HEAT repeat domain-containing protein [SAR324 cluster bacterium]
MYFRRAKQPGLKRLYLGSLAGFAERKSGEVTTLLEALLADPDVTVRHAAVGLAARLHSSPRLQAVLQERLSLEPDADLRAALRRTLAGN